MRVLRLTSYIVFALMVYIGNSKTLVFHAPTCKYADCSSCNVTFKSFAEAVLGGYSPCGFCRLEMDEVMRKR